LGTDATLWELLHTRRWTLPKLTAPPADGWFHDYARRHAQDAALPTELQRLRHGGREVRDCVWRTLLRSGPELLEAARALAMRPQGVTSFSEATEVEEAYTLLRALNQSLVKKEWDALLRSAKAAEGAAEQEVGGGRSAVQCEPPMQVEDGALLLVRWYASDELGETPDTAAARCRERLDALGVRLSRRLPRPFTASDAVGALSHLLFTENGYRGNEADYYNPGNSLLNYVLEKKTGLPISLSLLFAAVCRRVGISLDMIGLPGHFMLATQPTATSPRAFVDVFHGGKLLGLADCEEIVRSYGIEWNAGMVAPVPMSEVWTRMVRNLINSAHRAGDTRNAPLLELLLAPEETGRGPGGGGGAVGSVAAGGGGASAGTGAASGGGAGGGGGAGAGGGVGPNSGVAGGGGDGRGGEGGGGDGGGGAACDSAEDQDDDSLLMRYPGSGAYWPLQDIRFVYSKKVH